MFAFGKGYSVVLEGIFFAERYNAMLTRLIEAADESHVFYLDVSLEETLRRNETKPNGNEIGEENIRRWYNDQDLLGVEGEVIIPESSSLDETVRHILRATGL